MNRKRKSVLVVDPAGRHPELDCFNRISLVSALPCTYHLPKLFGMRSLQQVETDFVAGIVIFGSATSVYERADWQSELENFLFPLMQRGVPTLGLCYGHQMLAHMFGGKVAFMDEQKTKQKGWRKINMHAGSIFGASTGEVVVSHNETVSELPADFIVIGDSPLVPTDVIAHKTLPIFSFQSHPEATKNFLLNQNIPVPDGATGELDKYAYGNGLVDQFLAFAAGRN